MSVVEREELGRRREATVVTAATAVALAAVVAIAWLWLLGEAETMSSMGDGLAQVGRAMTFDMSPAEFMGMWATMMVAMMVPSIAPLVLAYSQRRHPLAATGARVLFLAGYLAVWIATGLLALVVLRSLPEMDHASAWLDRAGGAILVVAGAYQFTPWKQASLRVYSRSLQAPATFAGSGDPVTVARAGLREGLCYIGCCGTLIAILLAVGVMNLQWMAAITVIVLLEKNWRHAGAVTAVVGVALLGLGLAVLLHPRFLPRVP